jgi:hypothetical protein
MLTRQEIDNWDDPPIEDDGTVETLDRMMSLLGQRLDFYREKAEECLALSYQITDPKNQVAMLKIANCWMRLAEYSVAKNLHQRDRK